MAEGTIEAVRAHRIWDSRGRPTVEVEVELAGGARGRGIAPAGASRGEHEAIDLRDGGTRDGGYGVGRAIDNVHREIAPVIAGRDALDQAGVDAALLALDGTPNLSRLGGNATIATSMAVLHAAAAARGLPLWRHLAGDGPASLPLPEIQVFGGGAHAGRRLDLQDLLAMPVGARSFDEALSLCADVYHAAGRIMEARGRRAGVADEGGWWPDFDGNEQAIATLAEAIDAAGHAGRVAISLDVAASEFFEDGRYRLALDGAEHDTDGWIEVLLRWIDRYPIASIEDPVSERDRAGMAAFTRAAGARIQVIGDDFLVTSAARVGRAIAEGCCNAVLVKPNQAGTITGARAALERAREAGWGTIVSARSGETEDTTIVDLAVGWNAGQLKVGSFARSERMAKWNEGLRIERANPELPFAGRGALPAGTAARGGP